MRAKSRLVIIFCTAGILARSATVAVVHVLGQLSCIALRRLHKGGDFSGVWRKYSP